MKDLKLRYHGEELVLTNKDGLYKVGRNIDLHTTRIGDVCILAHLSLRNIPYPHVELSVYTADDEDYKSVYIKLDALDTFSEVYQNVMSEVVSDFNQRIKDTQEVVKIFIGKNSMLNNEEYLAIFKIADSFAEKLAETGCTTFLYEDALKGYYISKSTQGKHVLVFEGSVISSNRERHISFTGAVTDKIIYKFIDDMPLIRSEFEKWGERRKQGLEKDYEECRVAREKLNSYLGKYHADSN